MSLIPSTSKSKTATPLCPECEVGTSAHRCDGAIVFKCGKCHGLWLGGGKKLGIFRRALDKFNFRNLEVHLAGEDPNAYVVTSCSRCHQVLDKFHYGYNSGVFLYRCGRCQGMWMPLREMIHLMNSIKLGQSVHEDVRAWLVEIRKIQIGMSQFRGIVRALRSLV